VNRAYLLGGILVAAIAVLLLLDALKALGAIRPGATRAEPAPDFTLTDIYGRRISLSDFRGKVVILDFFYIGCYWCEQEIPHLKAVKEKFGGQVVIISIDIQPDIDTDDKLKAYVSSHDITWYVARDTAGVAQKYEVYAVPTLVVIDREGNIRYRHEGYTESGTLEEEVMELLGS